mmetsp:Transcript_11959/g.25292  ORF Transcript_11959/g.25292 Transcript_11959/m.25292 type:complete len:82 (+) Transcript_11959:639-884(+)
MMTPSFLSSSLALEELSDSIQVGANQERQQKDRVSLTNHCCYDNNNRSDFSCPVLDDDNSSEAMLMLLVWTLSAAIICCSF